MLQRPLSIFSARCFIALCDGRRQALQATVNHHTITNHRAPPASMTSEDAVQLIAVFLNYWTEAPLNSMCSGSQRLRSVARPLKESLSGADSEITCYSYVQEARLSLHSRYWALSIYWGSRVWPFRVTLRHRSRDHSVRYRPLFASSDDIQTDDRRTDHCSIRATATVC